MAKQVLSALRFTSETKLLPKKKGWGLLINNTNYGKEVIPRLRPSLDYALVDQFFEILEIPYDTYTDVTDRDELAMYIGAFQRRFLRKEELEICLVFLLGFTDGNDVYLFEEKGELLKDILLPLSKQEMRNVSKFFFIEGINHKTFLTVLQTQTDNYYELRNFTVCHFSPTAGPMGWDPFNCNWFLQEIVKASKKDSSKQEICKMLEKVEKSYNKCTGKKTKAIDKPSMEGRSFSWTTEGVVSFGGYADSSFQTPEIVASEFLTWKPDQSTKGFKPQQNVLNSKNTFELLCEETDSSLEFVNKLVMARLIPQNAVKILEKIKDNLCRNRLIYEILRDSDTDDTLQILAALQETNNLKAEHTLKRALKEQRNLQLHSVELQPSLKPIKQEPFKTGPVQIHALVAEIVKDPDVINNMKQFCKAFSAIEYVQLFYGYQRDNRAPYDVVWQVLYRWRLLNMRSECTVGKLIEILKKDGGPFYHCAKRIEKIWDLNQEIGI